MLLVQVTVTEVERVEVDAERSEIVRGEAGVEIMPIALVAPLASTAAFDGDKVPELSRSVTSLMKD